MYVANLCAVVGLIKRISACSIEPSKHVHTLYPCNPIMVALELYASCIDIDQAEDLSHHVQRFQHCWSCEVLKSGAALLKIKLMYLCPCSHCTLLIIKSQRLTALSDPHGDL